MRFQVRYLWKNMKDSLFFIYDKLMTKDEQKVSNIEMEFISFGLINAKMSRVTTRYDPSNKIILKRIFATPINGIHVVFGGIFLLKNYERDVYKIHTYYDNSMMFLGNTMKEDLYDFVEIAVTPIKFNSIDDIKTCNYKIGNDVMCGTFIGNQANERISYNIKQKLYRMPAMDKESYIQLIKEIKNEVKE